MFVQSTPWMCHNCMQTIRSEEKGVPSSGGVVKTQKEVPSAPGGCNCSACVTKRCVGVGVCVCVCVCVRVVCGWVGT